MSAYSGHVCSFGCSEVSRKKEQVRPRMLQKRHPSTQSMFFFSQCSHLCICCCAVHSVSSITGSLSSPVCEVSGLVLHCTASVICSLTSPVSCTSSRILTGRAHKKRKAMLQASQSMDQGAQSAWHLDFRQQLACKRLQRVTAWLLLCRSV